MRLSKEPTTQFQREGERRNNMKRLGITALLIVGGAGATYLSDDDGVQGVGLFASILGTGMLIGRLVWGPSIFRRR